MRSPVTCHVLDSSQGKPAAGVPVKLHQIAASDKGFEASILAQGATDADGRCSTLLAPTTKLEAGLYKMTFETGEYLETVTGQPAFYPYVEITFRLSSPEQHYHIPLLLSPYSYTTYRGS